MIRAGVERLADWLRTKIVLPRGQRVPAAGYEHRIDVHLRRLQLAGGVIRYGRLPSFGRGFLAPADP